MRVLKRLLDTMRGSDDASTYADVETMFGRTLVYDTHDAAGDLIRVLEVAGTWQSGSYVGRRWADLAFGYHRTFDEVIFGGGVPACGRMLMLGGGALSYPKHVIATHAGVTVDVIEIDPAITALASRYFFLDRLSVAEQCRLHVTHGDAAAHLSGAAGLGITYDVIVNDAFAALDAPLTLADARAAANAHALLTPHGLYVANVVSAMCGVDSATLEGACATLAEAFGRVLVIPLGADEPTVADNNVVIATDDGTRAFVGAIDASELWA